MGKHGSLLFFCEGGRAAADYGILQKMNLKGLLFLEEELLLQII